ncbi:hypothetical protein [Streptomyces sp. NPDC056663]|uniref:hypothetical protein n=1 Tax=Streptomyces sp. NPDC056663 TaxID=3345899 RepID=UPI003688D9B1
MAEAAPDAPRLFRGPVYTSLIGPHCRPTRHRDSDGVEQGIAAWCDSAASIETIDTRGADSFATFLPYGQWDTYRQAATDRGVSLIQGLDQPRPPHRAPRHHAALHRLQPEGPDAMTATMDITIDICSHIALQRSM